MQDFTGETPKKKNSGCLKACFIGCASIILLFFIVIAVGFILIGAGYSVDGGNYESSEYSFQNSQNNERKVKASYTWRYVNNKLERKEYSVAFELLSKDVEDALKHVDRIGKMSAEELGVDASLRRSNELTYQKLIWINIFKLVRKHANLKIDNVFSGFSEIFKKEKFSDAERLLFMITFIQNIKYKRPGGSLDLLPPLGVIARRYGDCDSKALLLYSLLEKMGYDCVLMWSYQYSHVMLGLAVNGSGENKRYNGRKYYFLETTQPGWAIGEISPKWNNLNYWHPLDISGSSTVNTERKKIDKEENSTIPRAAQPQRVRRN